MNTTLAVSIASPLLALGGVLFGLWLGHKRWRVEQTQKEGSRFDGDLKATYLELWSVVEDVHLTMRNRVVGLLPEEFGGLIADVNNFMIRKGLFIERKDRYLVLEYLFWTNEFLRRMVASGEGRAYVAISLQHDELAPRVDELRLIAERAERLRNALRQRIRQVVGAPPSTGWSPDERPSDDLKRKMQELVDEVQATQQTRNVQVQLPENLRADHKSLGYVDKLDDWIE
ncbi:hypothetical protein [Micromonospora chersina]|uniref:hypothetical protein n=1 Tax=Micromonospora chersina TaxID=47854 RepID=UPI0033F8122C